MWEIVQIKSDKYVAQLGGGSVCIRRIHPTKISALLFFCVICWSFPWKLNVWLIQNSQLFLCKRCRFGPVAQLGERTVRIREVRGFDPLQVHHNAQIRTLYIIRNVFAVKANVEPRSWDLGSTFFEKSDLRHDKYALNMEINGPQERIPDSSLK